MTDEPAVEPVKPKKSKIVLADEEYDCDAVVPFSVKKKGEVKWYCVGEMSGDARDTYLADLRKSTTVTKTADGKASVEVNSFKGMSTMMLKHCIFGYNKQAECSTQLLTPEDIISSWSVSLIDKLVVTASEINTLGEDSSEVSGND